MDTIENVIKTLNHLYIAQEALNDTGDDHSEELDEAMWNLKQSISYLESYRKQFIKFKKELGL